MRLYLKITKYISKIYAKVFTIYVDKKGHLERNTKTKIKNYEWEFYESAD